MATKTAKTTAPAKSEAEIAAILMGKKKIAAAEVTAPVIEKKTASRATFSGTLSVGLLNFGVKMYTATETNKLAFNGLHAQCNGKMNQKMHCFICEDKAKNSTEKDPFVYEDATIKGYEYSKGEFITVTDEELNACMPASEKVMAVTEFVPAGQVDPIYFEKTYFIGPDEKDLNAAKIFGLVRATMIAQNRVGVVEFTTRGRQNTGIIRPMILDGVAGLALHYMFYESEIRNFEGWNSVPTQFEAEELELAGQLLSGMSKDFDSKKHFDVYDANVRKLVAAKITNVGAPEVKKAPEPVISGSSLLDTLRASLLAAKK